MNKRGESIVKTLKGVVATGKPPVKVLIHPDADFTVCLEYAEIVFE
ncbi:MAG: hypothetical protein H8E66_15250 [Planctomycetes bacterium]|nr:hypothetical protein [Planctomycetota bacterium]